MQIYEKILIIGPSRSLLVPLQGDVTCSTSEVESV
jgi:hypothetical protein